MPIVLSVRRGGRLHDARRRNVGAPAHGHAWLGLLQAPPPQFLSLQLLSGRRVSRRSDTSGSQLTLILFKKKKKNFLIYVNILEPATEIHVGLVGSDAPMTQKTIFEMSKNSNKICGYTSRYLC